MNIEREELNDLSRAHQIAKLSKKRGRIQIPVEFEESLESQLTPEALLDFSERVQKYSNSLLSEACKLAMHRSENPSAKATAKDLEVAASRYHERLHGNITENRVRQAALFALLSLAGSAIVQTFVTNPKAFWVCIFVCFISAVLLVTRSRW